MKYIFIIPLSVVFALCAVAIYFALCTPALAATGDLMTADSHTPLPGEHRLFVVQHGVTVR